MFETVSPATSSRTNRPVLYEALSFSLIVHGLIGGVAVVSNLAEVSFPTTSPVYTIAFALSEAPAPPPPPPPPPKPAQVEEAVTTAPMRIPQAYLAPSVIPDEIPIVKPEIAPVAFAVPNGVLGGVDDGINNGILGGIREGDEGGRIGGRIGGVVAENDGRVHIDRDKKLPMSPLSQVYPNYPEDARVRSWEDELVVRYVIGKDGRVKEVIIVRPPQRDIFVDGTVRAIRSWRFKPMIKDGERQEVVHELTVYYRLNEPTT